LNGNKDINKWGLRTIGMIKKRLLQLIVLPKTKFAEKVFNKVSNDVMIKKLVPVPRQLHEEPIFVS
jgi:hypothetical protein